MVVFIFIGWDINAEAINAEDINANANLHIPDLSTSNLSLDKPVTSH